MRATDVNDELDAIRALLIAAASRNKEERFLRIVASRLKAMPPNGAEFLMLFRLAMNDPAGDFEEFDHSRFWQIVPHVALAFPKELADDIVREYGLMRKTRLAF
jgi:hypothetical protein